MRFRPEDRDELTETLARLTHASRAEPGCISYVPHWVEGEPATVLIYEQYADDAALNAHKSSAHFADLATGVLYQKMLLRTLENLDAIA